MGNDHGDMMGLRYNSEVNASSSTQRPKNGFVKAMRKTQPPLQTSNKGKEKVESQRSYQMTKKVEKRPNTSLKKNAPMS